MKKLLKPLLAIIVLFVIIVVGGSFYMLSYSLLPSHNKGRNEAYMWKLMSTVVLVTACGSTVFERPTH